MYDPLAVVASRPDWEVGWWRLPAAFGGITAHRDGVTYLILRAGQTAQQERAALAEEVAHAERVMRGHVLPCLDRRCPLNRREERRCRLVAAARLVGLWPILQMIREIRCSGDCNPFLYAEDLGIPPRLLLDLLAHVGSAVGPILPWWVA